MLQPIIEYLSRLLTGSRLDNPSTAWTHELRVDWSTLGYQLKMTFRGQMADEITIRAIAYLRALESYSKQQMTREEIEQLRQETIQGINALTAIPL
jgi:hypothetical protein